MSNVRLFLSILIFFLFFLFPKKVLAQVVINEFQIGPSSDQWIELFNKGEDSENLSGWVIDDNGGSSGIYTIPSDTYLLPGKCISFKGTFNWNVSSQDIVRLIQPSGVIESYSYSKSPGDYVSIGRVVDGMGDLVILSSQSRDKYNSSGESCVVIVESSTPSPTPAPTQTSYKAVYKINTSKDNNGSSISSVEIYVDGEYTHHRDDEILEFFNGHECYSGIECGLGIHTVSLRKTGYISWEDTEDFTSGMNLEVNPVLEVIQTPTPTPKTSSTPTPKPTSIKIGTVRGELISTDSGSFDFSDILGVGSVSGEEEEDISESKAKLFLPILIIALGIGFITFAIFSIIRNAKRKDLEAC